MAAGHLAFDRGDIVRVFTPHTDGSSSSPRPALIIADPMINASGDYLLIQITGTLWNSASDVVLLDTDPEFPGTGLQKSSTFRCHKMFPLMASMVRRKIGEVGPNTLREIERRLRALLCL